MYASKVTSPSSAMMYAFARVRAPPSLPPVRLAEQGDELRVEEELARREGEKAAPLPQGGADERLELLPVLRPAVEELHEAHLPLPRLHFASARQ